MKIAFFRFDSLIQLAELFLDSPAAIHHIDAFFNVVSLGNDPKTCFCAFILFPEKNIGKKKEKYRIEHIGSQCFKADTGELSLS